MSIFTETINAISGAVPPLHQAVTNAHNAMRSATGHLSEALDHLGRDYQQAISDKASAEAALADASRRVEELRGAALHLATVGDGIEKLMSVGEASVNNPAEAAQSIPQAIEEVQQVVTNAEAAVADTRQAVATDVEPAANV